jgi:hypothetical protein
MSTRNVLAEIRELERKVAGDATVWYQTSDNPQIKAEVTPMNNKFQYVIYRKEDRRSSPKTVLFGYRPSLAEAKKEVLHVFGQPAKIEKLMSAKPLHVLYDKEDTIKS